MAHTTEIVAYKKLSNGQVSFCIRCCGNESTDSWHTLAVEVAGDSAKRSDSLNQARERIANEHKMMQESEAAAIEAVGETKEHA